MTLDAHQFGSTTIAKTKTAGDFKNILRDPILQLDDADEATQDRSGRG